MLTAVLVALFGSFAIVRILLFRFARVALDQPNARSLHARPVPRTGGIAVLGAGLSCLALGAGELWVPLCLAAVLGAVSFCDDLYGMPSLARLAVHLAASLTLAWYVLGPAQPAWLLLVVLGVAWFTNLFNFMDGSDGLAGGMAVIGFTTYAVAAYLASDVPLAIASASFASAAAAFLAHNFHPARIFLGDVGSISLGFLAGGLGVVGWNGEVWPLWFPLLVFGPFVGDATITLVKRTLRGERVWRAHREHYYQRLVRMGLGHRGTAWLFYFIMTGCALAALFGRDKAPLTQAVVFACTSAALGAVALWIDLKWSRHRNADMGAPQ